ncbi:MAG: hypothetical protein ACTSRG_13925 [Candidatus Helarchaeota archaeon]
MDFHDKIFLHGSNREENITRSLEKTPILPPNHSLPALRREFAACSLKTNIVERFKGGN